MITALCLLTLVGLADALISLSRNHSRLVQALAAAAWIGALAALTFWSEPGWIGVVALILGAGAWALTYILRSPAHQLAVAVAAIAVVIWQLWPPLLDRLNALTAPPGVTPLAAPSDWGSGHWLLLGASILALNLVTANRFVRMVLGLTGATPPAPVPAGEDSPIAGRFIGALERFLIIALMLAGQGVSIAGVAAAKSIIRYPEISRTARHLGNGLSAEVFFIGTVTSWLVAVASVGIITLAVG